MEFGKLNYVVLGVYLFAMLLIGLAIARRQKSSKEYFLAGGDMPWLIVGMSMFASLTSATTFMGVPGLAYGGNVAIFFGVLISPLVAPVIILTFYPFYRRLNVTTSYQYIFNRYGRNARVAVSSLFLLSRVGWLGVVIYAPALALHTAIGMELWVAILLMGVLSTAYTVMGGLRAVLWTDVVQFVILAGGAVWVAVSLVNNVGFSEIISQAKGAGKFDVFLWSSDFDFKKMFAISAAFAYFFIFMQDYGTDQITVQRLMSVKSFAGLSKAVVFNSFVDVILNGLLLFIGLGLFAYYQAGSGGGSSDKTLVYYIINVLPDGVSGLIITAIFAAAMSSVDSGINSISAVVVTDFVKPMRSKVLSEGGEVTLARWLTVFIGGFAIVMAFVAGQYGSIVEAWNAVVSLFSGPVLAIFLLGILTKKANFGGWLIGAIVAMGATYYLQSQELMHWIYNFPFCFIVSFVLGGIFSLVLHYFGKLFDDGSRG